MPHARRFAAAVIFLGTTWGPFLTGLAAQPTEASIGLAQFVSAAPGISRTCFEPGTRTTIAGRVTAPVLDQRAFAVVTVRAPIFSQGSGCVSAPRDPNGTFTDDERHNLLAGHFLATDVRLGVQLAATGVAARLSAGAGNAWRSEEDVPYLLLSVELSVRPTAWLQLGVEGEYNRMQVLSNPIRRTYQNSQVVSVESLGKTHPWRQATSIGVWLGLRR